jgi:hypothetical protein
MVKKETPMTNQAQEKTPVEEARSIAAELEDKRRDALRNLAEIDDTRAALAFDAMTSGGEAAKRVKALDAERLRIASDVESLNAAIAEAGRRVEAAQAAADREDERRRAELARPIAERLKMRAAAIDAGLAAARENLAGSYDDMRELARLGAPAPSGALIEVNVTRAMDVGLVGLHEKVRPVPPGQRYSFAELFNGWASPCLTWSARVLDGEPAPASAAELRERGSKLAENRPRATGPASIPSAA